MRQAIISAPEVGALCWCHGHAMNGSVGMVKSIIYESPNGPADKNVLAKYAIVDFKQSTLSAD